MSGQSTQAGRVSLAGDAAGPVDGSTGEAIYWAVRSVKRAAAPGLDLLRGNTPHLADHERRLDAKLVPGLMEARRSANLHACSPGLFRRLLHDSAFFWQMACRIVTGEATYGDSAAALGQQRFLPAHLSVSVGGTQHHLFRGLRT